MAFIACCHVSYSVLSKPKPHQDRIQTSNMKWVTHNLTKLSAYTVFSRWHGAIMNGFLESTVCYTGTFLNRTQLLVTWRSIGRTRHTISIDGPNWCDNIKMLRSAQYDPCGEGGGDEETAASVVRDSSSCVYASSACAAQQRNLSKSEIANITLNWTSCSA